MNHDHHDHDQPMDPGLEALSARLDALGRAERAGAPVGLEDRVLTEVGRVFQPEPIAFSGRATPWWQTGTARVAAGIALLAGVSTVVYTTSGPGAATPTSQATLINTALIEQRIEGMLALAPQPSDGFGNEIASIELWADALSAESDAAWIGSDLADTNWWDAGWTGRSGGAL